MNLSDFKIEAFEVSAGEVIFAGTQWVYVWMQPGAVVHVFRIGATWLHPAAHAEKHLRESGSQDARVLAFEIPPVLDRMRIRNGLAKLLAISGNLAHSAQVGSEGFNYQEELHLSGNEDHFCKSLHQLIRASCEKISASE